MSAFPYLSPWLQCLQSLAPPRGLIHVGAGSGNALQYAFASMPRLLTIEADASRCARLQTQLANHAQCHLAQAVIAGQPGPANYQTFSQSNENGLCPLANLQALWPNIKEIQTESVEATTIECLMDQLKRDSAAFNWAFIDCLPAGEVLRGASNLPESWEVVVVRALNVAPRPVDPASYSLSLTDLQQQLSAFDLSFVAMEEENHPQMVRALFVRNPKRLQVALATLQSQRDKLTQDNAKLIADYADLVRARDELSALKDMEAQAKDAALAQRDGLSQERARLAVAIDEQTKLASEHQAALAIQQQDNTDMLKRIQQIEAENQEYVARQQMMQEELIKAEAQIEVIKDLLLREPGL